MASSSLTAERLARWRDDVAEVGPGPDADEPMPCQASARRSSAELRQELKRLKFVFTAAEAQRQFAERAQEKCFAEDPPGYTGGRGAPGHGAGEARRQGAKERNKGTKRELARAQEAHDQLVRDVAEARRGVSALRSKCLKDIQEAADLLKLDALEHDVDMDPLAALGGERGASERQLEEALATGEEGAKMRLALDERSERRRRLEEELREVERQRSSAKAAASELQQRAERERAVAQGFEALQQTEGQLGLPRVTVDTAGGTALLAEPEAAVLHQAFRNSGHLTTEAERTMHLEFSEDGRLTYAEPHPDLRLQKEADSAMAQDDLARLITLTWDRICKGPQERELLKGAAAASEVDRSSRRFSHGGA